MCGCHPSVYQELRRAVGRIEAKYFRGRHIFPRGVWAIQEIGKIENGYRHGTLLTNWTKPCDHPEDGEPNPSRLATLLGKIG